MSERTDQTEKAEEISAAVLDDFGARLKKKGIPHRFSPDGGAWGSKVIHVPETGKATKIEICYNYIGSSVGGWDFDSPLIVVAPNGRKKRRRFRKPDKAVLFVLETLAESKTSAEASALVDAKSDKAFDVLEKAGVLEASVKRLSGKCGVPKGWEPRIFPRKSDSEWLRLEMTFTDGSGVRQALSIPFPFFKDGWRTPCFNAPVEISGPPLSLFLLSGLSGELFRMAEDADLALAKAGM